VFGGGGVCKDVLRGGVWGGSLYRIGGQELLGTVQPFLDWEWEPYLRTKQ